MEQLGQNILGNFADVNFVICSFSTVGVNCSILCLLNSHKSRLGFTELEKNLLKCMYVINQIWRKLRK